MAAPIRYVKTCNGLRLSVNQWDPEEGRRGVALLLHGFLDVGFTWHCIAEDLCAAGYQVLAPDLRGFGRSEQIGPGSYYYFPDYLADVRDLLVQTVDQPLLLVGHSMGGTLATLYAGTFPTDVNHLVILEGVGPPADSPELAVDRMRAWIAQLRSTNRSPRALESRDVALARLRKTHPSVPLQVLEDLLPHLLADGPPLRWGYDPLHRTISPMPFSPALFASFVRAVTCPVLFIAGGAAGYHPSDESERLADFGNLAKFEITDAGHMMHWTHPRVVATRILDFIDGH